MPRLTLSPDSFVLFFLVFISFALLPPDASAQLTKPDFSIETYSIISSSGTTPFWLQSNRHGMFSTEGSQFLARLQAHGAEQFGGREGDRFTLRYGADFIARPGEQSTASFNQGYLRLDAWGLFLQAGRFHNTSPIHDDELGMGSLGVSGNATPIPQIRAGLSDWTSLPFTRDFIQVKGHIAHGWLGSRRFTENVWYHEKVGHARLGGSLPVNLYGGLAHYAVWGGTENPRFGDLSSSPSDFWKVFFVQGGDEDAPEPERLYMLGDHLGAWDFGMIYESSFFDATLYRQFPLETKDNLKLKSLQDALTGISIRFHDRNQTGFTLKGIVYEYLYTKWQDGPRVENEIDGVPCSQLPLGTCRDSGKGNENYYNHSIYRSGWSYQFRTIGNPLFRIRDDNLGIDNSRIVAHHIGLDTSLSSRIQSLLRLTYSRNYGTRSQPFESVKHQWSAQLQFTQSAVLGAYPVELYYGTAFDNGDLFGSQVGIITGIRLFL